jgi:hypothetical protein
MAGDQHERCVSYNGVEVSVRHSNHADQEKLIREVLQCDVFGVPKTETRSLRRPQKRLSPDQLEALFESYERGDPVNVLAEEFSIHRSAVLDHLNGSTARRRYPGLDDREVNVAKQLYGSGLSLRDVGTALEVHARTVRSALLNAGVQMRDRHQRNRL